MERTTRAAGLAKTTEATEGAAVTASALRRSKAVASRRLQRAGMAAEKMMTETPAARGKRTAMWDTPAKRKGKTRMEVMEGVAVMAKEEVARVAERAVAVCSEPVASDGASCASGDEMGKVTSAPLMRRPAVGCALERV